MRDKYVEERFPSWKWVGSCDPADADLQDLAVQMMDGSGDVPQAEALIAEHNRTVGALIDACRRLSPEQQAEWLAAWDRRPHG